MTYKLDLHSAKGKRDAAAAASGGKRLAVMTLLAMAADASLAQSASPGSSVVLDPVVVRAPRLGPSADVRERFEALPGGVTLLEKDDFDDTARPTLANALADAPGVIVQEFFGNNDQPRVQIRGSGLQQNPVERGVLMLQDGLPINRADGSYIVGFANPQQAQSIEVYRGYIANRLGSTVLGGALNFVSPTGSQQPGTELWAAGGSFDHLNLFGQIGGGNANVDGLFQIDHDQSNGYRDYNRSQRTSVGGNVGYALSSNVATRVFLRYSDLQFDVSGPLPKSLMEADPRQVFTGPTVTPSGPINPGPNVVRDRPMREANQFIAGARTTATFDHHLLDFALGYTRTEDSFRFPVSSSVRDTDGDDYTLVLRYALKPEGTVLPLFEATAQYASGSADRENHVNQSGASGLLFGQSELDATTLSLYGGFNLALADRVWLSPSVAYGRATRDNNDIYNLATRPTIAFNPANPSVALPNGAVPTVSTSYARTYDGWSPSLALSYRPDAVHMMYAAVSRTFEPPTHDDLLATVNGTPNSSAGRPNPGAPMQPAAVFSTPDLDAQTSTTLEGGWRGKADRFWWDAVVYYSWIDGELLSLRDSSGAPLGAVNADKTRHFGVELGLGATLTDTLSARLTYTYQDFRFDGDPLRGDNQLAGVPRHFAYALLRYQPTAQWDIRGSVRWKASKTWVDNMNTQFSDSYALLDLSVGYSFDKTFTVFAELTNAFDTTYAASTLIVDQARADQAAYIPGSGRAINVGIRASF
jgi:iron complex outermembrane receptor protein